jgi:thiosulfate dehydrogenase [quinone] large subunit
MARPGWHTNAAAASLGTDRVLDSSTDLMEDHMTIQRDTHPAPTAGANAVDRQYAASRAGPHAVNYVWAALRIVLGWVFLWAFLDKLFGLGYATPSERSWLNGGSPTRGFLTNSASGPFKDVYTGIAGTAWADWLFMLGLLGIGTALLLGIGMRIAAVSGALLYLLMWTAVLPPTTNPIVDDHIIGALVLIGLVLVHAGDTLGLGRWWKAQPIVQGKPWLI